MFLDEDNTLMLDCRHLSSELSNKLLSCRSFERQKQKSLPCLEERENPNLTVRFRKTGGRMNRSSLARCSSTALGIRNSGVE